VVPHWTQRLAQKSDAAKRGVTFLSPNLRPEGGTSFRAAPFSGVLECARGQGFFFQMLVFVHSRNFTSYQQELFGFPLQSKRKQQRKAQESRGQQSETEENIGA